MISVSESSKNLKEINSNLKRKIKEFNGIQNKSKIDYDLFIIDLQTMKDNCDFHYETSEGHRDAFKKKSKEIDCLIGKYRKEQVASCLHKADALLERIRKVHW